MSDAIRHYINEFRSRRDLDPFQAEALFDIILAEEDEDILVDLLSAWAAKGATQDEIYRFARVLRSRMKRVDTRGLNCVDIVGTGGSSAKTFNVSTAAALVIAGAGHITRCLAPLARDLGFQVWIVDERSSYANSDRFPPPLCPVVGEIAGTLRQWDIDESTYVVIVTRGHRHDEAALSAVLHSSAKYVGMIGSQRKTQVVFDDLRHQGFRDVELSRVHAPIGLAIGAKTAEEIALSIAAELIKVRRATSHAAVEGPFAVHQSGGARDSG